MDMYVCMYLEHLSLLMAQATVVICVAVLMYAFSVYEDPDYRAGELLQRYFFRNFLPSVRFVDRFTCNNMYQNIQQYDRGSRRAIYNDVLNHRCKVSV